MKFVCVHGHFYQPPRENPWLNTIECQDSAYPYHDWNERIASECYEPNTASRILNSEDKIVEIVNNYNKISFNFGPTLLQWMEINSAEVYEKILSADKKSREQFGGHGSALAQCYNHMIMPLANARDKRTQVKWGIEDFKYRFGRVPEGMWLPETAVDVETLDIMAEQGIKFTILSPHQAAKTKKLRGREWETVEKKSVDIRNPYLCKLPSGREIAIFFYDDVISKDVAFDGLLSNGEDMAKRLAGGFSSDENTPELMHIATDGETYGHYHRYAEMALSYCLFFLESRELARLTVYGEYLELNPPKMEVEITENTSWSCVHGVERWRSDCGCTRGSHPEWKQTWRKPLRDAMDWLRDRLGPIYENIMSPLVEDPWGTRDDYIDLILDRSPVNTGKFFRGHAKKNLSEDEKVRVLKLLEMQRFSMLMYTSCGWFFEEVSRIEGKQVMQYASRAIQLAQQVTGEDLEKEFIKILRKAPSNVKRYENAAQIYESEVVPTKLDLLRVGAHYAVSSIFREYPESHQIYCYTVKKDMYHRLESGRRTLVIGKINIMSNITWKEQTILFGIVHLGDHNIIGGIQEFTNAEQLRSILTVLQEAFNKDDISEVIQLIDKKFDVSSSIWHLFRDEQRTILKEIISSSLEKIESSFREIFEQYHPVMNVMRDIQMPLPHQISITVEFVLNNDLKKILESKELDIQELKNCIKEIEQHQVEVDKTTISYLATNKINQVVEDVTKDPENPKLLEKLVAIITQLGRLPLEHDLWKIQNIYFQLGKEYYEKMQNKAGQGDEKARRWKELFGKLGKYLGVKITS